MNGPEHYAEAERRLLMAWEDDSTPERSAQLVAEAQVHATLAFAAAYALSQPIATRTANGAGHPSIDHYSAWLDAAAPQEDAE